MLNLLFTNHYIYLYIYIYIGSPVYIQSLPVYILATKSRLQSLPVYIHAVMYLYSCCLHLYGQEKAGYMKSPFTYGQSVAACRYIGTTRLYTGMHRQAIVNSISYWQSWSAQNYPCINFVAFWRAGLIFQFGMGLSIYFDKHMQERCLLGNVGPVFYFLPVYIQDVPVYMGMAV